MDFDLSLFDIKKVGRVNMTKFGELTDLIEYKLVCQTLRKIAKNAFSTGKLQSKVVLNCFVKCCLKESLPFFLEWVKIS